MPSLLASFAESWRDAVRDVVLIVVSIVIAFGVDAWWDGLGERTVERAHLEALLTEFQEVQTDLTRELQVVEGSELATREILSLMSAGALDVSSDSLGRLVNVSFNVGGPSFAGGALAALLGSGDLSVVEDRELASRLAGWPRLNDQILNNSSLLTRNREEEITDYLVGVGVPISKVATNLEGLDLPNSPFDFDPRQLLSDPAFESMFVSRAVRTTLLRRAYQAALSEANTMVRMLDSNLPD